MHLEKFTQDNVAAQFLLLSFVIVTLHIQPSTENT